MARISRVVVPAYPHHVTQRGNRSQKTFFSETDYQSYLDLVAKAKDVAQVHIWAYCLMPNHVHWVAVPERQDSLAALFRVAHRKYTRRINFRMNWRGHLWQERFHSSVMDERHLLAAVRYVELNPVRAQLCKNPEDWAWSSARAHIRARDDVVTTVSPMLERVSNWGEFLADKKSGGLRETELLRKHTRTGRPIGGDAFVSHLECLTGRTLRKKKPGPKPSDT